MCVCVGTEKMKQEDAQPHHHPLPGGGGRTNGGYSPARRRRRVILAAFSGPSSAASRRTTPSPFARRRRPHQRRLQPRPPAQARDTGRVLGAQFGGQQAEVVQGEWFGRVGVAFQGPRGHQAETRWSQAGWNRPPVALRVAVGRVGERPGGETNTRACCWRRRRRRHRRRRGGRDLRLHLIHQHGQDVQGCARRPVRRRGGGQGRGGGEREEREWGGHAAAAGCLGRFDAHRERRRRASQVRRCGGREGRGARARPGRGQRHKESACQGECVDTSLLTAHTPRRQCYSC